MNSKLDGRNAFVTGGSGDIGRAIATALAQAGANVAVSYVGWADGAQECADVVRGYDRKSAHFQLDQRSPHAIEQCAETVRNEFGDIDVLVNNAAWNIGIPFADLESLDADTWDRINETNLRGPYLLARAFAPQLKRSSAGRIVNVASTAGIAPGGSSIAYAASKAGLIHLTRCLAVALAPQVSVNCVAPGLVEGTRMAARLPETRANYARGQAVLGRVGDPIDIARQVVVFCEAQSVTGQVLVVDGGMPGAMR